jgi:hypothetical protein
MPTSAGAPGTWRSRATPFLPPAALLALNVWICWRLFSFDVGNHFASGEGSFIAMTRYLSRHWGDHSWWPIWHGGMPFQNVYVPLLHLTATAYARWSGASAAQAYHAVTGLAYCFGPVTLYWMALRFGASRGAAFLGGLFYSLLSPSGVIMPDVGRDIGGWMYARRLQVLVGYGEGPHVTAMTLAPIALLALEGALHRRTSRAFALAAIALALVFLTNVPGTMGLGLAVFCWLCVQPAEVRLRAWKLAMAASVFGYAIACYGIPPLSLLTVGSNVGPMHQAFSASLRSGPLLLGAVLAAAAGVGWILTRLRLPLLVRYGALYSGLLALLVMTANHKKFELLPQVGRLHVEMEMGVCLVLGMALWAIYGLIPGWVRPIAIALCLMPLWLQIGNYRWFARVELRPVDLTKRSEYASARWLDANAKGGRTYAVGSTGFWLNAFTDTPQIVGCCEQGQSIRALDTLPGVIDYGDTSGDLAISVRYLQAMGVQSMVVSGPDSTDEYKDILKPQKFAFLPLLHRELGDSIYAIPQRTKSLAHVIRADEAVGSATLPPYGLPDVGHFVDAIEDPARPEASFRWIAGGEAAIEAPLRRTDLLSVQVPWFSGWRAELNGRRIATAKDGLGMILLRPELDGDAHVRLIWTGTPDLPFAAALSVYALTFALFLLARRPSRA